MPNSLYQSYSGLSIPPYRFPIEIKELVREMLLFSLRVLLQLGPNRLTDLKLRNHYHMMCIKYQPRFR